MAITYTGTTIGKIVIKQGEKEFTIQIRTGNCLAVLIQEVKLTEEGKKQYPNAGGYIHNLYSFFLDESHLSRLMIRKGKVLFDDVVSIELNMLYEQNYTLLEYFVKSGHKVKCYYKEEK